MLYGSGRDFISIDDVKDALNSKELKKVFENWDDKCEDGLVARGRCRSNEYGSSSNREKSRSKSRSSKIHYGKKEGHQKNECKLLKEKKKKEKKSTFNTSNAASVAQVNYEGDDLVLSISTSFSSDALVLVSDCSYHMTSIRDWFTTYRSIRGGEVLMENNVSCKVVGMGVVRIKMYDNVIKILSDVCHMPNLRKNIVFGYIRFSRVQILR